MDIQGFIKKYNSEFLSLPGLFEVSDNKGNSLIFDNVVSMCIEQLKKVQEQNKKIITVGNGGSAAIASHQAIDYWRNGKIRTMNFNDSSLLTCIANDFSYSEVFSIPIEKFADNGDIIFCISSSGQSKNILNAAEAAIKKNCKVYTFSGFKKDNPLRQLGDLNFFVPSFSYGFVEILHLYIIHCLLDAKLYCIDKLNVFDKNMPL